MSREAKFADFLALSESVRLFLGLASARRDFSFNLLSTAIQLCAGTQEVLDHFRGENATIDRFSESATALREDLERFEERDFDGNDVLDLEDLEEDLKKILRSITDSFHAILAILKFVPSKGLSISSSSRRPLMAEK